VNIMACRVFRNVKLGRYSRVILVPTHIEAGNVTQYNCKPIINGENSYHMGDMNAPMSAEFSRRKESESWRFPTTNSNRLGMETPSTHLGGVEVTKVIELTRDWKQVWRFSEMNIHSRKMYNIYNGEMHKIEHQVVQIFIEFVRCHHVKERNSGRVIWCRIGLTAWYFEYAIRLETSPTLLLASDWKYQKYPSSLLTPRYFSTTTTTS
jgi:hypothetical protein